MSPESTYKLIIKSDQTNTWQKLLGYTAQALKPCSCLDLRPKKDSRVYRDIRGFNRWDAIYLKEKGAGKTPTVDSRGQAEHSSYCILPLGGDKEHNRYRGD